MATKRASRFAHGRIRFDLLLAIGGINVATIFRRDVIATDSPFRISRNTEGKALRIWRTVAVFMYHQYVSPKVSVKYASTRPVSFVSTPLWRVIRPPWSDFPCHFIWKEWSLHFRDAKRDESVTA